MSQRITLKDVAAKAGVSQSTVSLYLGGNNQVCSTETAERIEAAVADLNYVARRRAPEMRVEGGRVAVAERIDPTQIDASGHSVSAGNTAPPLFSPSRRAVRTLGVAIPHSGELTRIASSASAASRLATSSRLADQVWAGAAFLAECEEYGLLMYPAHVRDSDDPAPFLDGAIVGLILSASSSDPRPPRLAASGLPVILVGSQMSDVPDGCGAVYASESDVVDLALSHLWSLGHRRIAHLAGPVTADPLPTPSLANADCETETFTGAQENAPSGVPSDAAIRRMDRYRTWMRVQDAYDPTLVFTGARTWQGETPIERQRIEAALDAWMALPEPPTAVFCASDALALALLSIAQERGLSIPSDLAVVGVGNCAAAEAGTPLTAAYGGLTSVSLPGEQIGREAVRQLLRMVEGVPAAACRVAVPVTQIIKRGSTVPNTLGLD